jgi:hypothetical protein
MSNPYRDALADLYTWANEHCSRYQKTADVMHRTRVLLTQPESEKPADDKLMDVACATDLVFDMGEDRGFASPYMEEADIAAGVLAFAHEVPAKYGNLPQDQ